MRSQSTGFTPRLTVWSAEWLAGRFCADFCIGSTFVDALQLKCVQTQTTDWVSNSLFYNDELNEISKRDESDVLLSPFV